MTDLLRRITLSLVVTSAPALAAEDPRQLAPLPEAAAATLRAEMNDNLMALNEIISALAAGRTREAGEIAEARLGMSAMGRHRGLPVEARPGPHMPPAMHQLGMAGHRNASDFAAAAAGGDRERALAALPALLGGCVACHASFRIR